MNVWSVGGKLTGHACNVSGDLRSIIKFNLVVGVSEVKPFSPDMFDVYSFIGVATD